MPTLRSGLVIAGGYADKVRRVLFAQLREQIKSGELDSKEVARAAGELNRLLFEVLVSKLKVDKGDVVRITVDYEVEESTIKWQLDTLRVEVWRRVPEEDVTPAIREVVEKAEELVAAAIQFSIEKLGKTDTDDVVYAILYDDREVGALLATPLNGEVVIRGAVVEPTPLILRKTVVSFEGELDDYIANNITEIMRNAENVERREAERIVREIRSLIAAAEEAAPEEEEV
ncbi:MAG: DUF2258 domain-containing protein [Desulfurococcales archaeon]|nr:DUF2258 domain-containing protein [Desulfurococcales archaeon]